MTTIIPPLRHRSPISPLMWTTLALIAIGIPYAVAMPKIILWNASASVPEGLYLVLPSSNLRIGDLVVTHLPHDIQVLAGERKYLPRRVLLIKPVAAIDGSEICRHGLKLYIDGRHIADAKSADRLHRPMPNWQGCRTIAQSELFLMNPAVSDSFDGRYFGPIARRSVMGRAVPLLTFAPRPNI